MKQEGHARARESRAAADVRHQRGDRCRRLPVRRWGERGARLMDHPTTGLVPTPPEAERTRVIAEIDAGIYREPVAELPLEEHDPTEPSTSG